MANQIIEEEDPHNNSVELVGEITEETHGEVTDPAADAAFKAGVNAAFAAGGGEKSADGEDDSAPAEDVDFAAAEASLTACNENVEKLLAAIKDLEGEMQTLETTRDTTTAELLAATQASEAQAAEAAAAAQAAPTPGTVNDLRLHEAAKEDDIPAMEALLADPEVHVKNCDVTGRTALFDAAGANAVAAAAFLIEKGLSVNATTLSLGETPLMEAAGKGHLAVVKLLVEKGATLDVHDSWVGETALQKCCRNKHWPVAKFLLQKRADVGCQDESGRGPLHWAASTGSEEGLNLLFEYGADLDFEDLSGTTPLHLAVQKKQIDAVRFLVKNGASVNSMDNTGLSALCMASMKGFDDIAKLLVDNGGRSGMAAHLAAIKGNVEMLDTLMNVGSDLMHVDEDGKTPLMDAAFYGREEAVKFLVGHYKDMGEEAVIRHVGGGHSALSMAVVGGNAECVKFLLDNGAEIASINAEGWSALHQAAVASVDFREAVGGCIRTLVEHGARVNQTDSGGRTPLYLASYVGSSEVVVALLSCGAETNIPDKNGLTPLHQAVANGHAVTAKVLLDGGADPDLGEHEHRWTSVHQAVLHQKHEVLQILIEKGGDVNTKDIYGNSPLHLSVFADDVESAMRLLDGGCKIDATDENDQTALHHAAYRGAHTLLLLLLQQGANANSIDAFGVSPLDDALREKRTLCAKVLVQHGATAMLFKVALTEEGDEHSGEITDAEMEAAAAVAAAGGSAGVETKGKGKAAAEPGIAGTLAPIPEAAGSGVRAIE